MPELPDITLYIESLTPRIVGQPIESLRVAGPFVVRTYDPSIREAQGRHVLGLRRIGKQIAWELEDELFLIFYLMIAGRFHWKPRGATVPARVGLASFEFPAGTLLLTESSTRKRAALHLVRGQDALEQFDRGGLEVLGADLAAFREALLRENHTLKRALTDPRLFSGIGNAYSDEILFHARLSPVKLTSRLLDDEIERLYRATRATLLDWTERLRRETGDRFPEKVAAFRPEMAVHGRYKQPCRVCGAPIQRIVHAENETNYCARCQTDGRLLADRALSRLLHQDWPRSLDEMESKIARGREMFATRERAAQA